MATYVTTIAGSTVQIKDGTFRIREVANGINQMEMSIVSKDGTYRPAYEQEVICTEDGARVFGGVVRYVKESGLGGYGVVPIVNAVTAFDFNYYASRRYITVKIPAGTLKAALQIVAPYLAPYGVSLSGSQANGPSLPELVYTYKRVSEILNDLSVRSQWLWNIDYYKVLSMAQPSSVSAPFNITAGDGNVQGDLAVDPFDIDNYGNRIIVRFTADAIAAWGFIAPTAILNGEKITIGSTEYTFQTTLVDDANNVKIGASVDDTLNNLSAAMEAVESSGQGSIFGTATKQNSAAFGYVPRTGWFKVVARKAGENGNGIDVGTTIAGGSWFWEGDQAIAQLYGGANEELTNIAEANDGTEQTNYGLTELVFDKADIRLYADAKKFADSALIQSVACRTVKKFQYVTPRTGIHPGQTQTITLPLRNLSGTFLISDLEIFAVGNLVRRRVTVQGGSILVPRWQDDLKKALSGSSSGSIGTITTAEGGTTSGGGSVTLVTSAVPIWFGGGEEVRTKVATASTWYRGRNGGEPIFDSYKLPTKIKMWLLMLADGVTGGNAQCRVVAGSGDWSNAAAVSGTINPVTDSSVWQWQEVEITPRTGLWAYRIEVTSNVNNSAVGFRAYLVW